MPLYYWQGIDAAGSQTQSVAIAANRQAVWLQLQTSGITPLRIYRRYTDSKQQLKQALTKLMAHLAWLLQAHVPLAQALQQLPHATSHAAIKQLAYQLQQRVLAGQSLAEAIRPLAAWLAPEYHAFIAAGEITGRLSELLSEACRQQQQQDALWRQIQRALRYPLLLLLSTFGICIAMLLWIIPQYANFLADMHTSLPPLTQSLIQLTHALQRYGGYGGGLLLILLALAYHWRTHPRVALTWHSTLLRLPLLGHLLLQLQLYRWCYLMAVCSQTELPLLDRVAIAHRGLHNRALQQRFTHVQAAMLQGLPLQQCLQHCRCFTHHDLTLITLGEQSATLTQVFSALAQHYHQKVLDSLHTLTTWLEPILLLGLGGVTALMILAFYQPMIHLGLHL